MKITRILFILLVSLAGLNMSAAMANKDHSQKNLLVIMADDLNDWVGAYGGHPQAKTPNIDRLASMGVRFENFHTAVPLCNPSRAAVWTGIRPHVSGIHTNNDAHYMDGSTVLHEHLQNNGFYTIGAGKIFHGGSGGGRVVEYWDKYTSYKNVQNETNKVNSLHADIPDSHKDEIKKPMKFRGFDWYQLPNNDELVPDHRITTDFINNFNNRPKNKPFAAFVGQFFPHLPWILPKKYFDMFPLESIILPEKGHNDTADIPVEHIENYKKREREHQLMVDNDLEKQAVQAYLASTYFADQQIGRILDMLEDSGEIDNTIIVFWSDHGWHFGEKNNWHKQTLWEEATRTPFAMVVPGMTQAGSVTTRTADSISIFNTVFELLGVKAPAGQSDGISIVPLLKNPQLSWEHPAISTNFSGSHSVRSEHWRYTRYASGGEELYDHRSDQAESVNLLHPTNNKRPEFHALIRNQLKQHLVQGGFPLKPPVEVERTSQNTKYLKEMFKSNPTADSDKDGVMSKIEWTAYKKIQKKRARS